MIMVLKRSNIIFIVAIFVLSLALIGINNAFLAKQENNPANSEKSDSEENAPKLITGDLGKGKTVVLDPGHGGEDPGAVSEYTDKVYEKNINLYIANQVKTHLEAEGYTVIMTRTEDVLEYDETAKGETQMRKQDLQRRKKLMDESGADIVVSIHLNKYPDAKIRGAQTFFVKESKSSQKLAESIQTSLVANVAPDNKRVALVKKDTIIITKDIKVTTAIVECGFLSNIEEEKKLADQSYQDKIAAAIKLGIDGYFKA